ncbi:hypothetical protein J3R30DRAFT_900291 [Lentinula aciculospora]|uniref:Uncharacterized protein n=1 Tax=Lentinula aciculospora TaxID=153920 RepID=A0A9W9DWC5_9AGAR|nr:hypothetical protein J3R30DRAFT_900291 [Lentinula aciculospora]
MSSPKGYILTNVVSHTRFIPFRYSFKYTTVAVFADIAALEDSNLDTPLLFGYDKRWRSLCSLSSDSYLFPSSGSDKMGFREKINILLQKGGYTDVLDGRNEIWMLSMPSYFGFEGINPLTVYFVYSTTRHSSVDGSGGGTNTELQLVLFEVHNTFGEGHVYFMRPGVDEDLSSSKQLYDFSWTFPRAFHVSPFNDRKGWYTVSIKLPQFRDPGTGNEGNPKPVVSIQLREPEETPASGVPGKTKLTATLRATRALPLPSARNLLFTLISYPLELFLSMPRILYQAGILHYVKGDEQSDLKVYIRPEPLLPPLPFAPSSVVHVTPEVQIYPAAGAGLTIRRRQSGVLASWAKERVRTFLRDRVQTVPTSTNNEVKKDNSSAFAVVLIEPDACVNKEEWFIHRPISAEKDSEYNNTVDHETRILRITPLSPEFFEFLLTAPSAGMVLFTGGIVDVFNSSSAETHEINPNVNSYSKFLNNSRGPNDALFVVNDPDLFMDVFDGTLLPTNAPSTLSLSQRLRISFMPSSLVKILRSSRDSQSDLGDQGLESVAITRLLYVPETHFLDSPLPPSFSTRSHSAYKSTIQEILPNFGLLSLMMTILTLSALEPRVFALSRARMHNGTETWGAKFWERVERRVRSTME